MKWLAAFAAAAAGAHASFESSQKTSISKVVQMLEKMLADAKSEGKTDRDLYAKYKCYCDTNTEEMNTAIADNTDRIARLSANIERLQGESGELSLQVAKLTADIADTEQAIKEAQKIRDDQNEAFIAEEKDLKAALASMKDAINTLTAIGADLTDDESRDDETHQRLTQGTTGGFMQRRSMMKLAVDVKQAMSAANSMEKHRKLSSVLSLIQRGDVYGAQSGQVVGILKNMRDTFEENLKNAQDTEAAQAAAHAKFLETKNASLATMRESREKKYGQLGENDTQVGADKAERTDAEKTLASDQEFLADLTQNCKIKTDEYEERKMTRAQEEASVSEAIAILSSDDAFDTFNTNGRTDAGSFIQIRALSTEQHVVKNLLKVSKQTKSLALARLAAHVQAGNPFTHLFGEIDKLIEVIDKEEVADDKKFDFCEKEQRENRAKKSDLETKIDSTKAKIAQLNQEIVDHNATIEGCRVELEAIATSRADATQMREEEAAAHAANTQNLDATTDLLTSAQKVLKKFYEAALSKRDEREIKDMRDVDADRTAAPEVGEFKNRDGENKVISLLDTILEEVSKERADAVTAENEAIAAFEAELASLKSRQEAEEALLADTEVALATATESRASEKKVLASSETELEQTENYLAEIKPGCDFIQDNISTRKSNRSTEKAALENAKTQLSKTPAFLKLKNQEEQRALGPCKDTCNQYGKEDAECQSCLHDVSVPAYCTSNPETPGCSK
jgi:hypothetical protein